MTKIQVQLTSDHVIVTSPYHPQFPSRAKQIGGRWQSPNWVFDARDEERVRELCREIYGTDGTDSDLVTLRITVAEEDYDYECAYYAAGCQVARVTGRDSGARLGEGVVVLSGGFGSTGSRKNPAICIEAGTVFELRDVPRAVADKMPAGWISEIVDESVDVAALTIERERLIARLAEIDALIEQHQQG